MPKTQKRRLQPEPAAAAASASAASKKARIDAAADAAAAAAAAKSAAEQKKKMETRINYNPAVVNRKFWGLVLKPLGAVGSDLLGSLSAGKHQRVGRDYQLHITSATLLLDEGATCAEVAAARCQLWVAMCETEDGLAADKLVPKLVCSLSASGRETQKLSVHLSGQIVRLIAVGSSCSLHLSGCLEHDQDEPEEDSSDDDMFGSDRYDFILTRLPSETLLLGA